MLLVVGTAHIQDDFFIRRYRVNIRPAGILHKIIFHLECNYKLLQETNGNIITGLHSLDISRN